MSIADIVSTSIKTKLGDTVEVGEDFMIVELPIHHESEISGKQISELKIRKETGASILGVWIDGRFDINPGVDTVLDDRTVLLVAGNKRQLKEIRAMTRTESRIHTSGGVVIAGYGDVGSTIHDSLDEVPTTVIDKEGGDEIDIEGDATDEETLVDAGVRDAHTLVVTISDDTEAIFTVLVARELNPSVEILVRANRTESISKLYRAGSDYVLGLPNVTGRLIALNVLGEDIMTVNKQIKMVRTEAPRLAGKTIGGADVGGKTGSTVVAVERGEEIITEVSHKLEVQEGDKLVVAGSDESINKFESKFVD